MNIANIGAFGAGLVRGDITAREQRRLEEDQAFQNEQRVQLRDQWARDREERDAVAGVERPGVYRDPQAILDQDFTQSSAVPTRTVTDADFARGLSRAYKYSPDKAVAALGTANQFDERQYQLHQRKVTDAALRAQQLVDSGDHIGGMRHLGEVYRTINDGKDIVETVGPNGEPMFGLAQAGKYLQQPQAVTPELARQAVWSALKFATPDMFKTVSGLENQSITANAARTNAEAATKNAATTEGYRSWMQSRPTLTQDGTGRVLVTDPDGNLLRTLGNPRPVPASGSAPRELPPDMVKKLNEAAQAVDTAKTPQERLAAQQAYMNLYSLAATQLGKVLKPGEVRGNFTGLESDRNPVRARYDALRQSVMSAKDMDPMEKNNQLTAIDKMENTAMLQPQVALLSKEERVPELRKLMGLGMYSPQELNSTFGFSYAEIKEAQKPEALAQPKAGQGAGGTATNAAAPAQASGDKTVGLTRPAANPYVDSKGKPTGARVPGDDQTVMSRTIAPAVKNAAVAVVDASKSAERRYLQSKIDTGQPLTPTEKAQARRAGLIQ